MKSTKLIYLLLIDLGVELAVGTDESWLSANVISLNRRNEYHKDLKLNEWDTPIIDLLDYSENYIQSIYCEHAEKDFIICRVDFRGKSDPSVAMVHRIVYSGKFYAESERVGAAENL